MADEEYKPTASEKKKEDWMNSKWRPMMGWMYMLVCTMDFVGFPILWSLLQMFSHGAVNSQWQPLTLQGAGLFHIAMGAVIGVSAYGRTQEKLGGANNGGMQFPQGAGTSYIPPTANIQANINTGNQAPASSSNSFGGTTNNFGGSSSGGFGSSTGGFGSSGFGSSSGSGASAFGSSSPSTGGFGSATGSAGATASTSGFGSPDTSSTTTPAITTGFGGKKVVPSTDQPAI
jgi:hypothetical protein